MENSAQILGNEKMDVNYSNQLKPELGKDFNSDEYEVETLTIRDHLIFLGLGIFGLICIFISAQYI